MRYNKYFTTAHQIKNAISHLQHHMIDKVVLHHHVHMICYVNIILLVYYDNHNEYTNTFSLSHHSHSNAIVHPHYHILKLKRRGTP